MWGKITDNYTTIPEISAIHKNANYCYVHYTDNETINGLEFREPPDLAAPLVVDMTSNLMTKSIDINRFALIYASTQKNLGIPGLTVIIAQEAFLAERRKRNRTLFADYTTYIEHHSMLNTPPTFTWYVLSLMLKWMLNQGGVEYFARKNQINANKLYSYIDASSFYSNNIHSSCRSYVNIVFTLENPELTATFLTEAKDHGLLQLEGHRLVHGIRASCYNAMPLEGVESLITFMQAFKQKYSKN